MSEAPIAAHSSSTIPGNGPNFWPWLENAAAGHLFALCLREPA